MPGQSGQLVAIVGCGFFAPNHIHAWRQLGVDIVGVCDLDASKAEAAGRLAGAPAYADADKMIAAEKPTVVDIVTTGPSHLALARVCAARGVSAIIQKPLAPTLAEAVAIVRAAEAAGVPMMVHENFRFQRPIRLVGDIVRSGRIGDPHYCRIEFRCGHDIFTGQPYLREDERLVLNDIGVHVLDVTRFLMGEISDLSCRTQHVRSDVRGEDMATVLIGFENGGAGVVGASWSSFLPDDPFPETMIEVNGSKGAVILDRHYRISVRSGADVERIDGEAACPTWGGKPWHVVQDSVVNTCRHWVDAARGKRLETSVTDNVKTLAAVEACYRSAARGGALVRPSDVLGEAMREDAVA